MKTLFYKGELYIVLKSLCVRFQGCSGLRVPGELTPAWLALTPLEPR